MKKILNPAVETWHELIKRPTEETYRLDTLVDSIFEDIKINGDDAIRKYNKMYDNNNNLIAPIDIQEINDSEKLLSDDLRTAISTAANNIELFHATQKEISVKTETTKGVICWRESRPIATIGLYIPGGSAPLFSTVLMLGIPAKIAGCERVVLCTPVKGNEVINPAILYAAKIASITEIYAVGGIQAIAAMALGNTTIPKVDKIFGPGNQYVAAAKQKAQQLGTTIDIPAGPSEVLIIANKKCNPSFVAADLLSQAEHGPDSQVLLLSDDEATIDACLVQLNEQLEVLPRKGIAKIAIDNSIAIVLNNLNDCVHFSNHYAPEHLILAIDNANQWISNIKHAGSVFIGNYSCESAGDYASGTNHTLPTNGHARSFSGVSLDSFIKKITFQQLSAEGILSLGPTIEVMAEAEELWAHKNAVTLRLKSLANV